jgi:hypothetical protein
MATMKEITRLLDGWNTSGTNSKHDPAFKSFCIKFRNALTKELSKIGATDFKWNVGHYYISGFFTTTSGQIYYFSLSDVRGTMRMGGMSHPLMYRTAQHHKDWTGGSNQWVNLEDGMSSNMSLR